MNQREDRPVYRVLSTWAIAMSGLGLAVIGAGVTVWLLMVYGNGTDADRVRLEAVKTAGTIVVGTGGAAALWLAARRQRTTEIALEQKDIEEARQERMAAALEMDAAERRVTELYTKAADQLGADKGPVRLAGMYALERLAQGNPSQRQTIVNVLCAYLRMPYEPVFMQRAIGSEYTTAISGGSVHNTQLGDEGENVAYRLERQQQGQEHQVRLTAQRILADHLRPGDDLNRPDETFWPNIDLELIGATLLDFDLNGCHVRIARFHGAWFSGYAGFREARFNGHAGFGAVRFSSEAEFGGAEFRRYAMFDDAEFNGDARFNGARFRWGAGFGMALFNEDVMFGEVEFNGKARFSGARVRVDLVSQREWPVGYIEIESAGARPADAVGQWAYVARYDSED